MRLLTSLTWSKWPRFHLRSLCAAVLVIAVVLRCSKLNWYHALWDTAWDDWDSWDKSTIFVVSYLSLWMATLIARSKKWSSSIGLWLGLTVHPLACGLVRWMWFSGNFVASPASWLGSPIVLGLAPSAAAVVVTYVLPVAPKWISRVRNDPARFHINGPLGIPTLVLIPLLLMFPLDFRSHHDFAKDLWGYNDFGIYDRWSTSGWDFTSVTGYMVHGTYLTIGGYSRELRFTALAYASIAIT